MGIDEVEPIVAGNRPTRRTISVLDIFAGAGGLSAGLARATRGAGPSARFRTVHAVEMDPAAAATYSRNHGGAEVYVGPIQAWLNDTEVPQVDVIIGGPPCQGFSTLGKQDVEDERNALWREYADTIVRAQPKYFVVENVAAFMASPQYGLFQGATDPGGILSEYTFRADVLNAADHGAFQARRRAVLIGHHRDLEFPGWPDRSHVERHRTVREAFRRIPDPWDAIDLPDRTFRFAGRELPGVFHTRELHLGRNYTQLSIDRFKRIPPGGNRFDIKELALLPECWKKHRSGSADVMGRLRLDAPAVTIRTEFFKPEKGRYLHPTANRAITHLEAAVLQGFPLDYRWVGSKTAIARQIGNAVPLQLGEAIGKVLLEALN